MELAKSDAMFSDSRFHPCFVKRNEGENEQEDIKHTNGPCYAQKMTKTMKK